LDFIFYVVLHRINNRFRRCYHSLSYVLRMNNVERWQMVIWWTQNRNFTVLNYFIILFWIWKYCSITLPNIAVFKCGYKMCSFISLATRWIIFISWFERALSIDILVIIGIGFRRLWNAQLLQTMEFNFAVVVSFELNDFGQKFLTGGILFFNNF
jgi:hypothetical protein